jgi:regulator of protease activity HflC (stomatin/prohibitin superfamily)
MFVLQVEKRVRIGFFVTPRRVHSLASPMDLSQVAVDMPAVRFWSWAGAYAIAALALWTTRRRNPSGRPRPSRAGIAIALGAVALAWIWPQGLGRVQPGDRGIVLRFGAPTGTVLGEGLYYVLPLADVVVQMNAQINTITLDRAQGTCSDLEPVYADLAVSFHVIPARVIDVYRRLRFDYATRVVYPSVQDAWKTTVATFQAGDLVAKRPQIMRQFRADLAARLAVFGLGLDAVNTTRINYSYAYQQAAQDKVAAVQHTLQAEQDLQRIRFEAQQSVIRAKSEVEALKLQRSVPAALIIQQRRLDLQRRAIDKWDGHLPQSTLGTPFLDQELGARRD